MDIQRNITTAGGKIGFYVFLSAETNIFVIQYEIHLVIID